jgi:hypothetical protein
MGRHAHGWNGSMIKPATLIFFIVMIIFLPADGMGECVAGDCVNGRGTFVDTHGNTYEGDWQDERPNGRGTLALTSGDRFEGEWKDGELSGRITRIYPDGRRYEGEWRDGRPDGQGKKTYRNGNTYEGTWKKGIKQGHGTMTYAAHGRALAALFVMLIAGHRPAGHPLRPLLPCRKRIPRPAAFTACCCCSWGPCSAWRCPTILLLLLVFWELTSLSPPSCSSVSGSIAPMPDGARGWP